jgi:hypothetical protein
MKLSHRYGAVLRQRSAPEQDGHAALLPVTHRRCGIMVVVRGVMSLLVLLSGAMTSAHVASVSQSVIQQGDYQLLWGASGLELRYKGVPIVVGSSLTVFKPGYAGAYFSGTDFTQAAVQVQDNRLSIRAQIADIDGEFRQQVVPRDDGVSIEWSLRVRRPIERSPVELALLMFSPEEFAGGSYRLESLFGQARAQPLPLEKPKTSAAGTQLIAANLRGITLVGRRVEVKVETLGDVTPAFYDMRSRQFPEPQRVYWLLYSWTATQGEITGRVRLQARLLPTAERQSSVIGRVYLTEGGRRVQVQQIFVHPQAHPIEKAAARELQRYLREMTGKEIPVTEGDGNGLPAQGIIYVGRSVPAKTRGLYDDAEYEPLGADGFILRLKGGNLLVAGGGYRGTAYAVYRLLERLGCRFYSTEMEIVPSKPTLVIRAPLNLVDKPAFEWRAMWGRIYPMTAGLSPGEWEAKVGELDVPKMMGIPPRGFWHHTMGFLLPADSVPREYLAEIGGERRIIEPHLQQYCLSNPALQKAMTDAVLRWIESTPDPVYYPVHYGDTGQFCQCERCKAWYERHGSLTDAVIWFNNQIAREVAKRFPGKFVTTLAYWATRKPPVKERPEPNHLIIFCAIVECQARAWSHPVNVQRNVIADLERWIAMHPLGAQGIITFEYPTTYYYVGYPYPALYAFAENLKYYRRLGIRGVYICGLTDGHLVHLYSYVMPRLMWNPDASLRRLIDEFCKAWYGKAWQPMRDYVHRLHQSAFESRSEGVMDCHAGPGQRFFRELFTRDWLDRQIYPLFAKAESLAEDDLIQRRIWREKWGVLYTDLFVNVQRARDLMPDESERGYTRRMPSLQDYRRMAELLHLTRSTERSWTVAPQDTLSGIIGFEPSRSPWWECPRVRRLMEDPDEAYGEDSAAMSEEQVARYLVRLESPYLIADITPAPGGRIWRLYHKPSKQDLLWRGAIDWLVLQKGTDPRRYVNFGGYEEYAGEQFGSPGWSEQYAYSVSPDRRSVTLTRDLPNGLQLTRTIALAADEAAIAIESRLTNRSSRPIADVVLRTHPQFRVSSEDLSARLVVRKADGSWHEMPLRSETYLRGADLPAGAWGIAVGQKGITIVNEFDPSQVRQCYLYTWREFTNLELFSPMRTLAPGESLVLRHRYVVRQ